MRRINPRAWGILTEPEKNALSIQHGMNKSSWEAGEIMEKSHYKYLEIKQRAEQFLRMFTEHFQLFADAIPYGFDCPIPIREYLTLCIEKRYKPLLAVNKIKITHPRVTKAYINSELTLVINRWDKSQDLKIKHILNLVKEFDRWNNFRILPNAIREPSAFKRRLKNTHKKHIRVLVNIHPNSIKRMKKTLKPGLNDLFVYFPYLSPTPSLLKIKIKPDTTQIFTDASLYLFKDKDIADKYGHLIYSYTHAGNRDCKAGLAFWPEYRDIIKDAYNYMGVQNITPNRKYLRLAMEKLEII